MPCRTLIAVVATVLVVTALSGAGSNRSVKPDTSELLHRLGCLETYIDELEARIVALENNVAAPVVLRVPGRAVVAPPGINGTPPRAVPFQFNGMTYYHMPLSTRVK